MIGRHICLWIDPEPMVPPSGEDPCPQVRLRQGFAMCHCDVPNSIDQIPRHPFHPSNGSWRWRGQVNSSAVPVGAWTPSPPSLGGPQRPADLPGRARSALVAEHRSPEDSQIKDPTLSPGQAGLVGEVLAGYLTGDHPPPLSWASGNLLHEGRTISLRSTCRESNQCHEVAC